MDIKSFIHMSQSLKIKANLLLPHEYWLYLNFPKNDLDNLALQVSPFLKLSAACPTLVELERMQLWMVHICIANKLDLITLHIYIPVFKSYERVFYIHSWKQLLSPVLCTIINEYRHSSIIRLISIMYNCCMISKSYVLKPFFNLAKHFKW